MGSLCASPARERSQGSRSGSPQKPEAAAPLGELKMSSLPAGWAQAGAERRVVQMDAAARTSHQVLPLAAGVRMVGWGLVGKVSQVSLRSLHYLIVPAYDLQAFGVLLQT